MKLCTFSVFLSLILPLSRFEENMLSIEKQVIFVLTIIEFLILLTKRFLINKRISSVGRKNNGEYALVFFLQERITASLICDSRQMNFVMNIIEVDCKLELLKQRKLDLILLDLFLEFLLFTLFCFCNDILQKRIKEGI